MGCSYPMPADKRPLMIGDRINVNIGDRPTLALKVASEPVTDENGLTSFTAIELPAPNHVHIDFPWPSPWPKR